MRVPSGARGHALQDGLSGTGGTAPAPDRHPPSPGRGRGDAVRAWTELFRVSALFSVPGDALAGAAAVGRGPGRGTAFAIGASLCLYEAGMALNDWADREEDAVDRPHRPIPSGRISPPAALGAAGVLTAAGLALAARAGRPALAVATGLAATVWAYDLRLKHTKAGPAAMAAARSLDLLLGATATAAGAGATTGRGTATAMAPRTAPGTVTAAATVYAGRGPGPGPRAGRPARGRAAPLPPATVYAGRGPGPGPRTERPARGRAAPLTTTPDNVASALRPPLAALAAALPAALVLGAHTYGVTAVSRHEARGGSTAVPLAVLATTATLGAIALAAPRGWRPREPATAHRGPRPGEPATPGLGASGIGLTGPGEYREGRPHRPTASTLTPLLLTTFTGAYLRTAGPPLLHAALNPSPSLTQRAVGGGIRAMIPLQAALAAHAGAPASGFAVMALVPLARSLARKVSLT
ncbi:UbiA family prenyltransferase [Streptomyces sp. NPDC088744]|uniref:UbiA family prenyltransferase n=1 Tax=Streptomyces sp. NPDC088744 TaxID=3155061 RepID=UPI00344F26C9